MFKYLLSLLRCILTAFCFYLAKLCSQGYFSRFGKFTLGDSLRIVGEKILVDFKKKHALGRDHINAWIKEAEVAIWKNPQNIKDRYQTASFLEKNRVIFNIKGNDYRLDVTVDYKRQIVVVSWLGTHAEYTKKIC